MPRNMDTLQFQLLDLMAESGSPEGSGALLERVRARGLAGSQATLGRALRVLDERGFTLKLSNKGRVLSAEGRRWLADARRRRQSQRWTAATLTAMGQSTLNELRQSMVARRAIEGEIAYYAAHNASPADLVELGRIVDEQGRELDTDEHGAEQAVDFHVALAKACGNRFLAAAANLVRTSSEALETLMFHLGATVGASHHNHVEIVEAIASGDPTASRDAMVFHLDQLIRDVDVLLAQLSTDPTLAGAPVSGRSNGHAAADSHGNGHAGWPISLEAGTSVGAEAPNGSSKGGDGND